jgi:hypothetical protein
MNAHRFFRVSLDEAMRYLKRSEIFRHPLFAYGELFDPIEPETPFVREQPLPELEKIWHFRREAVPDYITLYVGRAVRERALAAMEEEYALAPAERFRRLEGSVACQRYNANDPETWANPWFTVIVIHAELSGIGMPVIRLGGRAEALTNPARRPWLFDPRAKVLHGAEAVSFAEQLCAKPGGSK